GFSLHAATRIEANDKAGLERLCRYVARPPLAAGRLEQQGDNKLSFALKTPWDDGTTHIVLSPLELLEKLAALVPPPRVNLVRYHGVLAPNPLL
ncbi:MAG: transposase, partial [Myxococcota bacterium]|nr:transposase [Myxococcota bacterium]